MDSQLNVAIVGATGVNGSEILSVINDKQLSLGEVRLLASENSEGEVYDVLGDEVKVEMLEEDEDFSGSDVVIFAVKQELAEQFVPKALETGVKVIDVSPAYRMDDRSFLAVRGFNIDEITKKTELVSLPNAVTQQLTPFLKTVSDSYGLERVSVTVLQSVATAGKAALDELWDQTMAVFRQSEIISESFQHQIAFNCFPQIGVFMENGYTKEETSIADEVRKLLALEKLPISVTAVRIPIFHGISLALNVEAEKTVNLKELSAALEKIQGVEFVHTPEDYPVPLSVATSDDNFIGRMRCSDIRDDVIDLWMAADGIRAGIAVNAVTVLERFIEVL